MSAFTAFGQELAPPVLYKSATDHRNISRQRQQQLTATTRFLWQTLLRPSAEQTGRSTSIIAAGRNRHNDSQYLIGATLFRQNFMDNAIEGRLAVVEVHNSQPCGAACNAMYCGLLAVVHSSATPDGMYVSPFFNSGTKLERTLARTLQAFPRSEMDREYFQDQAVDAAELVEPFTARHQVCVPQIAAAFRHIVQDGR